LLKRGSRARALYRRRDRWQAGRVSVDNPQDMLATSLSYLAPTNEYWREHQLDLRRLNHVKTPKLLELLSDLSPDLSRALWDFILLCNPGYEAKAFKPGTETIDKAAQKALDAFLDNLHGPYTVQNVVPAKVIIGSMFMCAFLRGAIAAELVLDDAGRMPLEIATPDPEYIRFKRMLDPERGPVWQMGQWQLGVFVELDRPTIGYVPVHPFPGRPEGRSLAMPAVFSVLFLIGMLHDLRRVIAQQGYPRHDIVVLLEKLVNSMPEEERADPVAVQDWVKGVIKEIGDVYNGLPPDAAYVHTDVVEMKDPKGVIDARSLGAVDGIIKSLERMSVRALKSFPLMFGINEASSETHANRQWEIMAAGIKSIQQLCENLLERMLNIALQVQGIQAVVQFRFAELRAAELLRDAQVEYLRAAVARTKYATMAGSARMKRRSKARGRPRLMFQSPAIRP
jgi:hypothetical protein